MPQGDTRSGAGGRFDKAQSSDRVMTAEKSENQRSASVVSPIAGTGWGAGVRAQLARITTSRDFPATERGRRLLRYLTEETLAGRGARIKQFSIAVDILGRGGDFDPRTDPIVRTEASKLRRALQHYYLLAGKDDPLRFTLPKGAYVIQFAAKGATSEPTDPAEDDGVRAGVAARPRIAVVPLHNTGGMHQTDAFAVGLTEELSSGLARFRGLEVVSPRKIAGEAVDGTDPNRLAAMRGIDYVLTGSLRWSGSRMRLSAHLIDAITYRYVWSETFDRAWSASSAFEIEDDIVAMITGRLAGRYGVLSWPAGANIKICVRPGRDAAPLFHAYKLDHALFRETRAHLRRAHEADRDDAQILAMLAEVEIDAIALRLDDRNRSPGHCLAMAKKAVRLDPECQQARLTLGYAHMLRRDFDVAIETFEHCIALNANASYPSAFCGWAMALCGAWRRGSAVLERARRSNPHHPGWLSLVPLLTAWRGNDLERAHMLAATCNTPALCWDPLLRAATLSRLGRTEEARQAIQRLLELDPNFGRHAGSYVGRFVFDASTAKEIVEALSDAGLQVS